MFLLSYVTLGFLLGVFVVIVEIGHDFMTLADLPNGIRELAYSIKQTLFTREFWVYLHSIAPKIYLAAQADYNEHLKGILSATS